MEKLISRKEAAKILGISIATLDAARNNGLISWWCHNIVETSNFLSKKYILMKVPITAI